MRRLGLILALLLALLGTAGVSAREIRQGDECIIPADEVIQDNLFVLCRVLTINGRVEGNLLGAASVATLNGTVTGDVYLLAGQLDFNGVVGENLHFVGPVLNVRSRARFDSPRSDLVAASLSANVAAALPGSATYLGYELRLDGEVNGEVNFWGGALMIGGTVGGDVNASVGDPDATAFPQWLNLLFPLFWNAQVQTPGLTLTEAGAITGDLRYTGPVEATLQGRVTGATVYTPVSAQPDLTQIIPEDQRGGREVSVYLAQVVQEFVTLLVIGLIGLSAAYRPLQLPLRQMQARPLWSLLLGVAGLILGILLWLTVIGLGVLLILLLAWLQLSSLVLIASVALVVVALGWAGIFFIGAWFVSRVLTALFIGRWLVRVAVGDDGSQRVTYLSLIVGLIVLALLASLPGVGWVLNLAALLFGLGAVIVQGSVQMRPAYERAPALVYRAPDAAPPPPPLVDDGGRAPGMDNLPEGFRWWDS